MAKKNEDVVVKKNEIFAMTRQDFEREFDNFNLVDMDDMINILKRSFFDCDSINIAVTTENLNGNKNSFVRKLTDRLENSQEELAIAKKDVRHLKVNHKYGSDSRKAIAWVKTLETRYYKLFERLVNPAIKRIRKFNIDDVNFYKSYLKEEIQEQIALLNSDIVSLEGETKILKLYNNALRFNNRNTSLIYEKEDINASSQVSLTRLSAIENSGGEIDKVKCEIAELEERLNIINAKNENSIKDEMIKDLNTIKSNLILSYVANFGITEDLSIIKNLAVKTETAIDFEDLANKFYVSFMDKLAYECVLEVDQIKPLYLSNMFNAIDGYNKKFLSVSSMKAINEMEWAVEATKVALESAKAGFESEFTRDRLEKLVYVTNDPDDYFNTSIDSEFLNKHNEKFKAHDLVNLESLINIFNKKIKKTVKNYETRLQIKRLDSRIYDSHKNLYTDIMFWYQQALVPINDLFGTGYGLDFTSIEEIEDTLNNVTNEFEKAEKDLEKVVNALNATKSTMRNTLKAFDEELEGYIREANSYIKEDIKEVVVSNENVVVTESEAESASTIVPIIETEPIVSSIEPVIPEQTETLIVNETF